MLYFVVFLFREKNYSWPGQQLFEEMSYFYSCCSTCRRDVCSFMLEVFQKLCKYYDSHVCNFEIGSSLLLTLDVW